MNRQIQKGIFLAVLAAALYAISTPFSKLLLNDIPPFTLAMVILYLTALFLMAVGAWLCSSDEPLSGAE